MVGGEGACVGGPHRVPWVVGVPGTGSRASTWCAGFAPKALGARQWGAGCRSVIPPSPSAGRAKPGLTRADCGQGSTRVPGTGSEIGLLGDYGSEQQLSSLSVPWCSAGPKFKLSNRVHVWGCVPEHVIMQVSILVPALRLS